LRMNLQMAYDAEHVHSLAEMMLLQERFPENIKLFACYDATEMLAGVLIYETRQTARTQYMSASVIGKEKAALDLLLVYLLDTVYMDKQYFEFGTSHLPGTYFQNPGLLSYKEGFGARSVIQDTYQINL
ncbi:MAG TPA: hypothetical protein VJZ27_06165, partial [Aggregatilineales bacterium]|nr:hypothetical protein [Aggregatilineales bacterium]